MYLHLSLLSVVKVKSFLPYLSLFLFQIDFLVVSYFHVLLPSVYDVFNVLSIIMMIIIIIININ